MSQQLEEYKEYYKARLKKYEGNPLYANIYKVEKELCDLVVSCTSMEDESIREKMIELSVQCGIALVKDQYAIRKKWYEEMQEPIKVKGAQRILDGIDQVKDAMELTSFLSEQEALNSKEQSVDGLTSHFYSAFTGLENIESWEKAEVPGEWKSEINKWVEDDIASDRKLWSENTVHYARDWDPNWKMDYDKVWEFRHRRLIPIPDAEVTVKIESHKRVTDNNQ